MLAARADTPAVGIAVPREGALEFIDTLEVVKDAPHPDDACVFVNFKRRPDIAVRAAAFLHCPTPNAAARRRLDPKAVGPDFAWPAGAPVHHIQDIGDGARVFGGTWTRLKGQ